MQPKRWGITLVETVVVIAIVTLLVGIVLVGVQSARESARRVACQNNLHQIGIALTSFSQSTRSFPSLFANRGSKGDAAFDQSAFLTILPELEATVSKYDPVLPGDNAKNLPPPVLRCPSSNSYLGYRYNYGSGVRTLNNLDGVMRLYQGRRPSEITDGLSVTTLLSERMSGTEHIKPMGIVLLPMFFTDDAFARFCTQLTKPTGFVVDTGVKWQGFQPCDLVYTHFATPNQDHWDCQGSYVHQILTARSYHSGGVFVLFADGHVSWFQSSVDSTTWKAIGTVAGNESVSDLP